jgi:hypothetical protein
MDADDISLPERFAEQVSYLRSRPDVSVVGTWCVEFTVPGVALFHKELPTSPDESRRFMVYRSPLAHPTVMFRREVFEAGHRYDPTLLQMQDYEFWSRLLLAGYGISNVAKYLLWFRVTGNFYHRRTGWRRAAGEVGMRLRFARKAGLLRPQHLIGLGALLLVRVAPIPIKRLAYSLR